MSTATAPAVFLTLPKYVNISPSPTQLPKLKPAPLKVTTSASGGNVRVTTPAASPTSSGYASSSCSTSNDDGTAKGKKRRLDHLTWEEKIQRKKLKNRVAAQTSRDRKKARMEEMEYEINDLSQRTEILQNKCESLQVINDSLLEKNQKLDMEVEILRQQLAELQEQQNKTSATTTCVGCEAILNGSAAGLTSNGLSVDTGGGETEVQRKAAEKEQHASGSLEDCCPLPTLQDMLLLDEEFDATKLEELAESLLAGITADMETSAGTCNETVAEITGGAERLLGSVVGTPTECMESGEHSTRGGSIEMETETDDEHTLTLQEVRTSGDTKIDAVSTTIAVPDIHVTTSVLPATPDTVYGTYDARTNSITIVMDDDTEPVNEAVEEIYCEGVTPSSNDDDYVKCASPVTSPSQVYLNVDCSDDEDDDLNFDPITKFLRPRQPYISPLAKSPAQSVHSAISDHGYESIMGSPTSTTLDHYEPSVEDFSWNSSFSELFPALV